MPSRRASSQSSTGWLPVSRSVTCWSRSSSSARRPARSMVVEPTSSSGSVVPIHRSASSDMATPGEHPVDPELPGVLDIALEAVRRPVVGVVGPADPGLLDPAGDRLEVALGEPEPAPDRTAGDQVEHRARLRPSAGEVEQRADHGEQRVGLRRAPGRRAAPGAAGPGDPRPRPDPSRTPPRSAARRTRCPGTSPGCRAARASGRRRAGPAPPRAAPRPGATGRGTRAPARSGRRGRAHGWPGRRCVLAAMSCCSQPRSVLAVVVATVAGARPSTRPPGPGCVAARARRGRARRAAGGRRARARCPRSGGPRRPRSRRARPRAPATGAAARHGRRGARPARRAARPPSTGMRVCPNRENRAGRSISCGRSRSAASTARCRSRGEGASTCATSRRQSSGCQARSGSRAPPAPSLSSPDSQALSRSGRCTAYDANSCASRRATA